MARIIETTMSPILTSYIQTIKTDNSVEELVVKKDDILSSFKNRFMINFCWIITNNTVNNVHHFSKEQYKE